MMPSNIRLTSAFVLHEILDVALEVSVCGGFIQYWVRFLMALVFLILLFCIESKGIDKCPEAQTVLLHELDHFLTSFLVCRFRSGFQHCKL